LWGGGTRSFTRRGSSTGQVRGAMVKWEGEGLDCRERTSKGEKKVLPCVGQKRFVSLVAQSCGALSGLDNREEKKEEVNRSFPLRTTVRWSERERLSLGLAER